MRGEGTTLRPKRSDLKLRQTSKGPRAHIELGVGQTAILLGQEDLSTWDIEELRQGRKRSKQGKFEGRPPKVLAREVYLELVRRVLEEAEQAILDLVLPAIEQLGKIIEGESLDKEDAIRLKAIQEVLNRVLGRPEQKVALTADTKPYQKVERSLINRDLGEYEDEDPFIEADYTEE